MAQDDWDGFGVVAVGDGFISSWVCPLGRQSRRSYKCRYVAILKRDRKMSVAITALSSRKFNQDTSGARKAVVMRNVENFEATGVTILDAWRY